jgi:hypothetical protein
MKAVLIGLLLLFNSLYAYSATGGTITTNATHTIHTFTSNGTFSVVGEINATVLVVAGGGAGYGFADGGGGGGGILYNTSYNATGNINVTVGAGGGVCPTSTNACTLSVGNGKNSSFGTMNAMGGGVGGIYQQAAEIGGSGGGGGRSSTGILGAAGTVGQGYAGGNGSSDNVGGGGGGAGGTGGNGVNPTNGGAGGAGATYMINGSSVCYGGGGGGGVRSGTGGTATCGGVAGSNAGAVIANASNNTGGGGGGGYSVTSPAVSSNGGSGIVIVAYTTPTSYCGDANCNPDETCATCPSDCGTCSTFTTDAPYDTFSCEPIINYQNTWFFNQGYTQGSTIGTCSGTTERGNNIGIVSLIGVVVMTGGNAIITGTTSSILDLLNITIEVGTNRTLQLTAGNYAGDGVTHIQCGADSSYKINLTAGSNYTVNLTYVNATYFLMTGSGGGQNLLCPQGGSLETLGATSLVVPILTTTTLREINGTTNANFQPTDFRTTYEGGIISKSWGPGLIGNDTKPTTNIFNASLLSPASQILYPTLSYYPSTAQAYTTMFNSSTLFTVVKNNTPLLIYDDFTSNWYYCISYSAPNVGPFTITCNLIPGSSSTDTGPVNVWGNISFSLSPESSYATNATNITFNITDNLNTLQYFGMLIFNISNNTQNFIYTETKTDAGGGIIQYELSKNGTYYINIWFKSSLADYIITPPTKIFSIQTPPQGWLAAQKEFEGQMSGWAYYLIAAIFTLMVTGFFLRYSVEGAGLGGLLCLWGFTLFNPNAPIAYVFGSDATGGIAITTTAATVVTTLLVAGAIYMRAYI